MPANLKREQEFVAAITMLASAVRRAVRFTGEGTSNERKQLRGSNVDPLAPTNECGAGLSINDGEEPLRAAEAESNSRRSGIFGYVTCMMMRIS
jgi:hypothetical protein